MAKSKPAKKGFEPQAMRFGQAAERYARFEREAAGYRNEIASLREALQSALDLLDASSFGGQKTYRCLTPAELQHVETLRKKVPG